MDGWMDVWDQRRDGTLLLHKPGCHVSIDTMWRPCYLMAMLIPSHSITITASRVTGNMIEFPISFLKPKRVFLKLQQKGSVAFHVAYWDFASDKWMGAEVLHSGATHGVRPGGLLWIDLYCERGRKQVVIPDCLLATWCSWSRQIEEWGLFVGLWLTRL